MLIQNFVISFISLCELFSAIICANNTKNLVNSLFGIKICNPFLSFTSSSSSGGIGGKLSSYLFSSKYKSRVKFSGLFK